MVLDGLQKAENERLQRQLEEQDEWVTDANASLDDAYAAHDSVLEKSRLDYPPLKQGNIRANQSQQVRHSPSFSSTLSTEALAVQSKAKSMLCAERVRRQLCGKRLE